MDNSGLKFKAHLLLSAEWEATEARNASLEHERLNQRQEDLLDYFREVGSSHIDDMLTLELIVLENEARRYSNSKAMSGSLVTAIQEIKQCQYMLLVVRNPSRYVEVDRALSLGKSRKAELPFDDARKAFRGHATRLTNLDKSRLTDTDKKIVTIRHRNLGVAEKLYIGMQQQALGVTAPAKSQNAGIEL
jgi:hypothetical protein